MGKKSKVVKPAFVQALEFLCLSGTGSEERHGYCMMSQNYAASFNGIVAAGTPIEEDLDACPHLDLLLAALDRTGPEYVITQFSPEKLLVRAGDFQAYVPCLPASVLSWPVPDPPACAIDDSLLDALKKVAPLVVAKAETVLELSIQLNAGSCLATNRRLILEAWHGHDLPSGLLLPKAIVTALNKSKKKLRKFGCSDKTATFYFEDETWLRTQLFQDRWPGIVQSSLNCHANLRKVPPKLFDAAAQVFPFSGGSVFIKEGLISSHPFDVQQEGSSLKLPIGSEHKERSYLYADLKFVAKHAQYWDEEARPDGTYFEGDRTRGLISHVIPCEGPANDEDIPF